MKSRTEPEYLTGNINRDTCICCEKKISIEIRKNIKYYICKSCINITDKCDICDTVYDCINDGIFAHMCNDKNIKKNIEAQIFKEKWESYDSYNKLKLLEMPDLISLAKRYNIKKYNKFNKNILINSLLLVMDDNNFEELKIGIIRAIYIVIKKHNIELCDPNIYNVYMI